MVGCLLFALLLHLLVYYLVGTFSLLCVLMVVVWFEIVGLFVDVNLIGAYVPHWLFTLMGCFLGCVFTVLGDLLPTTFCFACWLLRYMVFGWVLDFDLI